MNHFPYLVLILCFICLLFIENVADANDNLSLTEITAICEDITSQQHRINNFYVEFELIINKYDGTTPLKAIYEWAISGEKRFRKSTFYVSLDEPVTERFGLAVWDGKFLKSYDSGTNTGSLRNKLDHQADQPLIDCSYTRCLGGEIGSKEIMLAEILAKMNLEELKANWADNGKKVIISHNTPSWDRTWEIDLEKGYMITRFVSLIKSFDGIVSSELTATVSEYQEVKHGIWLPTKSKTHAVHENLVVDNDIIVKTIKVNDPEIEEYFKFDFPKGSQYYDYIYNKSARNSIFHRFRMLWIILPISGLFIIVFLFKVAKKY